MSLQSSRYPTDSRYPFNLEILHSTKMLEFIKPVTFFIGENGSGKSTLLQALARRCGIYLWQGDRRRRYYRNDYEELLHHFMEVEWYKGKVSGAFFAAEMFRNFTELLDEWAVSDPGMLQYFGGDSLVSKSHGECHMAFFESRCKIKGLYFLDEPENALSPEKQIDLLKVLKTVTAAGSVQFVIATHSPILLAYPDAEIFSFDYSPLKKIDYLQTKHYKIYRDFLNNREKYLMGL